MKRSIFNFSIMLLLCFMCVMPLSAQVVNELEFTIDLTDIYGSGLGYFDPTTDVIDLMGLDWVGATVLEDESERRFEEDPFQPGMFFTYMVIQGQEGDSTKWKCKAEPEEHFFNWGWEVSPDYWYTIQKDGHVAQITLKPNIFPIQPAIEEDVTVLFQVNMNNAVNFYTQEPIDPAAVEWVGLKGQNSELGAWAGSWLPEDTTTTPRQLHVLRDNGKNGDKVEGDFIFSAMVTFPAGNEGGPGLYKYGAYYEGALEVNSGENPLDNEMHGIDHWINIKVGGQTEILNQFGVPAEITAVAERISPVNTLQLAQNYPNPFNPKTTINYIVPMHSQVQLVVFNVQGQKVATLVDEFSSPGTHSVIFHADALPSGLYLYKLITENSVLTRKMLFVK